MDNRKPVALIRKWLTIGQLLNGLFYAAILILLFNPVAKALLIRGLMTIGFFQPQIPDAVKPGKSVTDITFKYYKGGELKLSALKARLFL